MPASELHGRAVIYHLCNVGFVVFSVACAASSDLGMLIAFRFFQGCFGSAAVNNGGGTIADLIPQEKRGGVIAIYALGPILGLVVLVISLYKGIVYGYQYLLRLAGQSMYDALGIGWGNSLLGFIAVACIPVPMALLRYGERLRKSFDASRL
ncbi:hypothetical protein PG996_015598 [Apiospora saccharicola]|uniref:Major facilitator superfamily (MFS) profile domain-containing protein n=1 Tax=Apiospora saccharicola TaxID=335842 RepID=A0ABR1TLL8_9PEZI